MTRVIRQGFVSAPWFLLAICAVLGSAIDIGSADDGTITVLGSSELNVQPSGIEIDLTAVGAAELTGDAIVKYQDAVRRTKDAFEKLEIKDLKIEERTLAITSGGAAGGMAGMVVAFPGGGAGEAAKPQIDITRSLRVTMVGIRDMEEEALVKTIGKLLDTAKDAGAAVGGSDPSAAMMASMIGRNVGSQSLVRYIVDDADEQREKAYQMAFAQAESRAKRLAGLARQKLGSVISVEESAVAAPSSEGPQEKLIKAVYGIGETQTDDSRLSSDRLGPIPVRVGLKVKFALEKAK